MLLPVHFLPGLFLLILGLGLQYPIVRRLLRLGSRRRAILLGASASTILLVLGYLLEFPPIAWRFPVFWATWIQCAALVETMCLIAVSVLLLWWHRTSGLQPGRRSFLQTAGTGLCMTPVVATGVAIVRRNRFQLAQVDVPIANLPKDLDGLRIVQVTDIHLSPFLSEREFAYAVDMANATRAHVAVVTGDLISRRGDPLDACLRQLARLRAEGGVLGCLGNHEVYTGTEDYVAFQGSRAGIDFLRGDSRLLRFGRSAINFAGVDYQRFHAPYLTGVERLVAPDAVNVLLSHNPDVFPVAAGKGFDLTVAGHTHGGQVDFEILHRHLSLARFYTPYVRGLYRKNHSTVYVSPGIGTIGVPVRIGAPPEISLLRLCAI